MLGKQKNKKPLVLPAETTAEQAGSQGLFVNSMADQMETKPYKVDSVQGLVSPSV